MLADLDYLEKLAAEEMQALAFTAAAGGVLAGAILGWAAADAFTPWAQAAYNLVTLVSAITALWFGLVWRRKRASHKSLCARLVECSLAIDDAGA